MCVFMCIVIYNGTFTDYTDLSLVNHPYSSLGGNKIKMQDWHKKRSLVHCLFLSPAIFSKHIYVLARNRNQKRTEEIHMYIKLGHSYSLDLLTL